MIFFGISHGEKADWVRPTTAGYIAAVRTYQTGGTGLRAQLTLTGLTHDCGKGPNTFYFDSNKIPLDVVKAILSLASTAMIAHAPVHVTYDCSLAGGGYGWGVALTVED